jgi:hypothetical protein
LFGLLKALNGEILEVCSIFKKLPDFVTGFFLGALLTHDVGLALRRHSELGKEVGLNCMAEELVLGLLAVGVLHISDNGEVYVFVLHSLLDEQVILVVSMSIHECKHALNHLNSALLSE